MNIKLGGLVRTLSFNMGTYKFIGELVPGENPLQYKNTANDLAEGFRIAYVITHAALLSTDFINGVEPEYSAVDVQKWVARLPPLDAQSIVTAWVESQKAQTSIMPDADKKKLPVKKK